MDDPNKKDENRRLPRWIKVLLGFSLAANLLIVGAAVGVAYRVQKGVQDMAGGPRSGIAFVAALERSDRRAVLQNTRKSGRNSQRDGRQEIQTMLANLRSDRFDAAAFEAALENQSKRSRSMQELIGGAVVARVIEMSPTDRAAYADRIEDHMARRGKRGGPHGDKHKRP